MLRASQSQVRTWRSGVINPGLRNPLWLGIVALTFIFPSGCGVEAIHFTYIGCSWYHNDRHAALEWVIIERFSIFFEPFNSTAVAGRLVHPHPLRMKDPETRTTATSFNCSFILQILLGQDANGWLNNAGLAFTMVPDSSAVPAQTMVFLDIEEVRRFPSTNTSKNGVEFNDPNDIHIGVNLRSMNSIATFTPPVGLAYNRSDVYLQVWIEYTQTLDIYIADYGEDKPTKPFSSTVNMSLLNEYMYIGFSAAVEEYPKFVRQSFSPEDRPPEILIDWTDPIICAESDIQYLGQVKTGVVRMIGIILGIIGVICIGFAILCFTSNQFPCPNIDQPIRFYLAHAGEDKNFTEQLYKDLKSTWSYKLNRIKVFFDRHSMPSGEDFTENINLELNRTQVVVVIVSREFFERLWPMTELVYLVRSKQSNDSGVRILPLFYKLTVGEVKSMLRAGAWDAMWSENTNHLDAKECRAAVKTLCKQHGVNYAYAERNNDVPYRQDVLNRVAEICNQIQEQRSRINVED